MLTHENVVGSLSAVLMQMGDHKVRSTDVLISFLPLAHMLERCCEVKPRLSVFQALSTIDLFVERDVHDGSVRGVLLRRHKAII